MSQFRKMLDFENGEFVYRSGCKRIRPRILVGPHDFDIGCFGITRTAWLELNKYLDESVNRVLQAAGPEADQRFLKEAMQ